MSKLKVCFLQVYRLFSQSFLPHSCTAFLFNSKFRFWAFSGDPIAGHAPLKSDPRRYAKVEIRPGAFHMVELPSKTQSPGPPQGPRTGNIGQQQGGRSRPISAPAARGRLPVSAAAASGTLPYQINTTELAPVSRVAYVIFAGRSFESSPPFGLRARVSCALLVPHY